MIAVCISYVQVFAQKQDTLYAKKVFFSTHIYDDSVKLSNRKVLELFDDTWKPKITYKWSRTLKPIGTFVTISGVGLTAYAIRGVNFSTITEGMQVSYKVISLPQLSAGVGLVVIRFEHDGTLKSTRSSFG
ncbi:MAG: hypothetical protein U5M51_07710 [Emticicia sp.]|nr:hypothetical protein [Emticicia sp.]